MGRFNLKEVCILRNELIVFNILLLFLLVSCDNNQLPHTNYYENYPNGYIPVIVNYKNNSLMVNEIPITDINDFRHSYITKLQGFEENTRQCLIALNIDKQTLFEELDSIFRVLSAGKFHRVFLLVNNIKDTVGFTIRLPFYSSSYPIGFEPHDTIWIDNFIQLHNDSIIINGNLMTDNEVDRKINEVVFNKERIFLQVNNSADYKTFIKLLERYYKQQQYFKELYSELNFNKKYIWLCQFPRYYEREKNEVDEEYKNQLYLIDPDVWFEKVIITTSD